MSKPTTSQYYLIAAAILATVAVYMVLRTFTSTVTTGQAYKAVFLTNNQVYFGHLTAQNDQYITLQDVYYVRDKAPLVDPALATSDLSLVKLGRELHAPQDTIQISQDQVLYIQELSPASRVLTAIQQSSGNR